jgi:hydrogenase-4 component F
MLELLLLIPALTSLICLLLKERRHLELVSSLGSVALLAFSSYLSYEVVTGAALDEGLLYMDSLSAFMLMLVAIVSLATSLYSIGYMGRELEEGRFAANRLSFYYALLHGFIMTMVLVCVSDNLGIMWIAIEATTLASAFLVSFGSPSSWCWWGMGPRSAWRQCTPGSPMRIPKPPPRSPPCSPVSCSTALCTRSSAIT